MCNEGIFSIKARPIKEVVLVGGRSDFGSFWLICTLSTRIALFLELGRWFREALERSEELVTVEAQPTRISQSRGSGEESS